MRSVQLVVDEMLLAAATLAVVVVGELDVDVVSTDDAVETEASPP